MAEERDIKKAAEYCAKECFRSVPLLSGLRVTTPFKGIA